MQNVDYNCILRIVGSNQEGLAYLIYKTLEGVKERGLSNDVAFHEAAEDENMDGTRADIVALRKRGADVAPARQQTFISYLSVKHRIDRKCIATGILMEAGAINAGAQL